MICLFVMGTVSFIAVVAGDVAVSSADAYYRMRLDNANFVGGSTSGINGYLYDSGGHACCFMRNLSYTGVGEAGSVQPMYVDYTGAEQWAGWSNSSNNGYPFRLYFDTLGGKPVFWTDLSKDNEVYGAPVGVVNSDYWRSLDSAPLGVAGSVYINLLAGGFTAIMVSVVGLAALIGLQVFGSGENAYDVKLIATVTFFSLLWALVSAVGVSTVTSVPVFGWLMYLLLSFAYFLGVWGEVNSGGTT